MYDSYRGICDGWSRIYVGALRTSTRLVASMLWLFCGDLWPFLVTPILVVLVWHDAIGSSARIVGAIGTALGVLHVSLTGVVSYRFWGYGHCQRKYLWLYPMSVMVMIGIVAWAWWMLVIRRRICWRGTDYAIDDQARILSIGAIRRSR